MPGSIILSAIKSVQRFTVTLASGAGSGSQTIAAVNMEKTLVSFLGASVGTGVLLESQVFRVQLVSATNVQCSRASTGGAASVSFEVIEYN